MTPKHYPIDPVLLVDDEEAWLRNLGFSLQRHAGINHLLRQSDAREVLPLLERQPVSLIILDVTMPHLDGLELLNLLVERHPQIPVIMLTGRDQAEVAVACMKSGAYDYYIKTCEQERFVAGVRRALAHAELQQAHRRLSSPIAGELIEHPAFASIVTCSPKMHAVFHHLQAVAPGREPVLICGESGVGKELVARALHGLRRAQSPWVAVNVAGLDEQAFSDTLFGHVRGAFTGADRSRAGMIEKAADGVLFLDEIGDLSPALQVKLLRLLQEREYYPLGSDRPSRMEARLVLATNRDLRQQVAAGTFRQDLYYRLSSHQVVVPALRERPEDIPLLLEHFVAIAANELERPRPTIPAALPSLLASSPLEGNVRELRGLVFDAVSRGAEGRLAPDLCREEVTSAMNAASPVAELQFPSQLPSLKVAGEQLVLEAMRRTNGNQTAAARILGISRPALTQRLGKMRRGD